MPVVVIRSALRDSFFWGIFTMSYKHISVPESGDMIVVNADNSLSVPDNPIIPYIEGDGIGIDISPVMIAVVDAAVAKAYDNARQISWMEIYTGEKAAELYDGDWFPEETLDAIKTYSVAIKGPLTTPVGGGFRSLNVALRQELDLYTCLRPVRWFEGVPSPVKHPGDCNMVIFRENSEDIYAGIEYQAGTEEAQKVVDFIIQEMGATKIRFPENVGIGIKPVSAEGTQRLVRKAIQYAIDQDLPSVTLVHKGNIMKFTEGAFRDWGYELATTEFRDVCITERESWILDNLDRDHSLSAQDNARMIEPGYDSLTPEKKETLDSEVREVLAAIGESHGYGKWKSMVLVDDRIADSIFQQIQTRPQEYSILATLNLNGDYISDAAAAMVGGLGMAPGANIGETSAIFEATHGTAPKHAGLDRINPGSVILSGVMMLEFLGWQDAADLITKGLSAAIKDKQVTYDLARLMEPKVDPVSCSGFADAIIKRF